MGTNPNPGFSVKISGVENVSAEMQAAIRAGQLIGMEKIGLRGTALVQERTPVAFGILVGGIHPTLIQNPGLIIEQISAAPPGDMYAAPVETGTHPHFPPPQALLLWVKKKLHVQEEKQALSIAYAIAKTIAKRGTTGAYMFQQALAQLQNEVVPILEGSIAAALQKAGFAGAQA